MTDTPAVATGETSRLTVSDASLAELMSCHHDHAMNSDVPAADCVRYIALDVVAAELRRMAEVIAPQPGVMDGSDDMTRRACAAELAARAYQLDGGALR